MDKNQAYSNWLESRPSRMHRFTPDASDDELAQRMRYGDLDAGAIKMSRMRLRQEQAEKNELLAEAKASILMDKMEKEKRELERELGIG